jgi:hypothetical protein
VAVLNRLRLFTQAVSLGDTDSLACHPASTTHSFVSQQARDAAGVTEGMVRLSVGIEHPDDGGRPGAGPGWMRTYGAGQGEGLPDAVTLDELLVQRCHIVQRERASGLAQQSWPSSTL